MGIFAVPAISTAWTSQEIIWLFLLGGVVAVLVKTYPLRARQHSRSVSAAAGIASLAKTGGDLHLLLLR